MFLEISHVILTLKNVLSSKPALNGLTDILMPHAIIDKNMTLLGTDRIVTTL